MDPRTTRSRARCIAHGVYRHQHWYALGRAAKGSPDKAEQPAILTALQAESDVGRLLLPLSSVTYTELTENPATTFTTP